MPKRALVIEAEQTLQGPLSPYFQKAGIELYGAASLEAARTLLPILRPDVAIVDRELRDGDGLDLIADVVEIGARAMIVSARHETAERIKALTMGAHDYLAKPADPEEVFLRARNLLAIQARSDDDRVIVREFGGVRVDLTTRAVLRSDDSHGEELTETEFALLRLFAQNIDRVVSREVLFPIVTGADAPDKPSRAIDTRISSLRLKLRAADAGVEIRSVRQAGYLFRRERGARKG